MTHSSSTMAPFVIKGNLCAEIVVTKTISLNVSDFFCRFESTCVLNANHRQCPTLYYAKRPGYNFSALLILWWIPLGLKTWVIVSFQPKWNIIGFRMFDVNVLITWWLESFRNESIRFRSHNRQLCKIMRIISSAFRIWTGRSLRKDGGLQLRSVTRPPPEQTRFRIELV